MPKKSRRVASRQARLSGRAKRERAHGPAGVPADKPTPPSPVPRTDGWSPAESPPLSELEPQEAPLPEAPRATTAPPPRPRGRAPQARPIETYFAPELRRIGLASAVIFIIMVALVFVLQ